MQKEREYRNQKQKVFPAKFYPWKFVLVWNERLDLTPFQPRWRGPYVLTHQISSCVFAARLQRKKGPGRLPILHFHVDQMQSFSIE